MSSSCPTCKIKRFSVNTLFIARPYFFVFSYVHTICLLWLHLVATVCNCKGAHVKIINLVGLFLLVSRLLRVRQMRTLNPNEPDFVTLHRDNTDESEVTVCICVWTYYSIRLSLSFLRALNITQDSHLCICYFKEG